MNINVIPKEVGETMKEIKKAQIYFSQHLEVRENIKQEPTNEDFENFRSKSILFLLILKILLL